MIRDLPLGLRLLHWFILGLFVVQVLYANLQIWIVFQPEGHVGPMWGAARDIPFELMSARRMYAQEAWIAFSGFAVYLGITEVLPRLLKAQREG